MKVLNYITKNGIGVPSQSVKGGGREGLGVGLTDANYMNVMKTYPFQYSIGNYS